jgi:transposase
LSAIASLRELTKQKVELRQGKFFFIEAKNTTQTCHCCQQILTKPISPQESFYCENSKCDMYNKEQHPDINAAKYIKSFAIDQV